jgi:tRNA threonylcarbamoyladenosine biosynthesis protein TsaE
VHWTTEADTQAFAQRMASLDGIRHAVVELHGDLGAGKTTFVRHLLGALGVSGRIKSPTYAVVEPHQVPAAGQAPGLSIWHFDFYRFSDPREWEDAGFRDLFASTGLKLLEWPDNARALLPIPDVVLALQTQAEDSRVVELSAHTHHGAGLVHALQVAWPPPPLAP